MATVQTQKDLLIQYNTFSEESPEQESPEQESPEQNQAEQNKEDIRKRRKLGIIIIALNIITLTVFIVGLALTTNWPRKPGCDYYRGMGFQGITDCYAKNATECNDCQDCLMEFEDENYCMDTHEEIVGSHAREIWLNLVLVFGVLFALFCSCGYFCCGVLCFCIINPREKS